MISRRILRVKVMQVLFAHYVSGDTAYQHLDKMLLSRIEKTKQLYFVYLQYLVEITQYALVDAAKRAGKHIPKEGDLNVNTDISRNSCILFLNQHETFKAKQAQFSTHGFIDKKIVKELFKQLQATEKYVNYCEKTEKTKEDDVEILRYIAKKIIGSHEILDENLSEHFMNLEDDHFITLHSLQKKLKDYLDWDEAKFLENILLDTDDSEDIDFAKELLNNTLKNNENLDAIIKPRLKNWDMERVALMDIILLKLAIVEFMYFPYIPLKLV
jgi:N utilization substance protein B